MPPLGVRPGAIHFRPPPVRRETPAAYHAPLVYAPSHPIFHAGLPAATPAPFHHALQQAAQRVRQTAIPQMRLTPAQRQAQAAALAHAIEVQTRRAGLMPGGSRIAFAGPRQVGATLHDLGAHQRFMEQGYQQLAREAKQQAAHRGDVTVPLVGATINPTKLVEAAASLHPAHGLGVLGNLANEAIDLPGQTFLSGAQTGAALRSGIAEGKWAPAEALGKSALGTFTHPLKSAEQSPLTTALMFLGAENAAGRLLGAGGRGLARAGLAPARTFARGAPDIALYGEGDLVPRGEGEGFVHGQLAGKEGLRVSNRMRSRDPLRAALEGVLDRGRYGKAAPLRPGEAPAFQARGAQLQKLVGGGHFKVGTVDIAQGAEQRSRVAMVRGTVNRLMQKQGRKGGADVGVRPKQGAHAVMMIAENLLHPTTFVADLRAELERYRTAAKATDEHGNALLVGPDRAANKASIGLVEGLLNDKKLLEHVAQKGRDSEPFRAAERVKQIKAPLEAALVHGGKLEPEQMRSALFSYALSHMDAKYHSIDEHVAAEAREAAAGRTQERQDAVSGRPPELVQAHRAAQEHVDRAEATVKQHAQSVRKLEDRRKEIVGQQRVTRAQGETADQARLRINRERKAQGLDPLPPEQMGKIVPLGRRRSGPREASRAEKARLEEVETRLERAKADHAQATAAHKAAREHAKAMPMPDRQPGLRGKHGEYLDSQTILDHMAERGHTPPTYFAHVRGVAGRQSYYQAVSRQPKLEVFPRTGDAHLKGLNDKSWEAVVGTAAKQASEVAQLELRRRFLNRFALDRFRNANGAHRAIENFEATPEGNALSDAQTGLGKLRAIHYGSGQIVESKGFQEHVNPADIQSTLHQFKLAQHTDVTHDELGHFGVIPAHVWDRYMAHEEAMTAKGGARGDMTRGMQAYAKAWRRAKLNTSMPHIFGVMQEQAIRVLAEQVGPVAWAVGRKYDRQLKRLAEVDKHGFMAERAGPLGERFRYQEAAIGGRGAVAGSGRWTDIVRKGEQAQGTGTAARLLRAGERTARSPGGRAILGAWHGWVHAIEDGLLRSVEEGSHHAHLGKALRETGVIDSYRSVLKAQSDAMKSLVEDRLTPNAADALARKVMDMYGNWTSQTPFVRGFVGKFAPFGLWYLNSLRWLYRLPLTHPVKAGVLAAMYKATAPGRGAEGQGTKENTEAVGKKPVPGFLQGTIPVHLPLIGKTRAAPAYYSPFGALGGQYGSTAAEQLLPYIQGPLSALEGVSSLTHQKLSGPEKEELQPTQIGLNTIAEALAGPTPLATQGQTLLQHGGKPYGTANWISDLAHALGVGPATVKPGTERTYPETLGKMFSPLRTVREKAAAGGGATTPAELREALESARKERSSGSAAAEQRKELREALAAARAERKR